MFIIEQPVRAKLLIAINVDVSNELASIWNLGRLLRPAPILLVNRLMAWEITIRIHGTGLNNGLVW